MIPNGTCTRAVLPLVLQAALYSPSCPQGCQRCLTQLLYLQCCLRTTEWLWLFISQGCQTLAFYSGCEKAMTALKRLYVWAEQGHLAWTSQSGSPAAAAVETTVSQWPCVHSKGSDGFGLSEKSGSTSEAKWHTSWDSCAFHKGWFSPPVLLGNTQRCQEVFHVSVG